MSAGHNLISNEVSTSFDSLLSTSLSACGYKTKLRGRANELYKLPSLQINNICDIIIAINVHYSGEKLMDIIQKFYDDLASQYDKLFFDWDAATDEQAEILHKLFADYGISESANILDCACGIGTQAIGLAKKGYSVTASDISEGELTEAEKRAESCGAGIRFLKADFCTLDEAFTEKFDIIIAMDNALPHMLSADSLEKAIQSISNQLSDGGIFVASIRDYDELLKSKPPYSPPYIHKTDKGQRVSFQTWDWTDDNYKLTQYIIDDSESLQVSRFECEYRATRRDELTRLLMKHRYKTIEWKFPEETGFYQPIVIARK